METKEGTNNKVGTGVTKEEVVVAAKAPLTLTAPPQLPPSVEAETKEDTEEATPNLQATLTHPAVARAASEATLNQLATPTPPAATLSLLLPVTAQEVARVDSEEASNLLRPATAQAAVTPNLLHLATAQAVVTPATKADSAPLRSKLAASSPSSTTPLKSPAVNR